MKLPNINMMIKGYQKHTQYSCADTFSGFQETMIESGPSASTMTSLGAVMRA